MCPLSLYSVACDDPLRAPGWLLDEIRDCDGHIIFFKIDFIHLLYKVHKVNQSDVMLIGSSHCKMAI